MSAENEIRNIKLFEEEIRNIKQMAFDAAHPVNETYTQYPQQDDPMTLYNKDGVTSVWEIQAQYSGAFFRSSNAPTSVYKADDEDQYYTQDSVTGGLVPTNVAANGGPTISPTPSGTPIVIEGKTYKSYAVTASSRNAADYIIKTNSLVLQESANKEHKHNIKHAHGITDPGHAHSILCTREHAGANWSDYMSNANRMSSDYSYRGATNSVGTGISINNYTGDSANSGGAESRPNNFTSIIWKRII